MTFKDTLEETYAALSANKARSSLTILGIVIGISSVIALVSVGQGASASISSSVSALGSNLLEMTPGATRNIGAGVSAGRGTAKTLTQGDADAILSSVSNVQAVSDEVSGSLPSDRRRQQHARYRRRRQRNVSVDPQCANRPRLVYHRPAKHLAQQSGGARADGGYRPLRHRHHAARRPTCRRGRPNHPHQQYRLYGRRHHGSQRRQRFRQPRQHDLYPCPNRGAFSFRQQLSLNHRRASQRAQTP